MDVQVQLRRYQNAPALYEQVVGEALRLYPRSGVFVDCGAHVGSHTAAMASRSDASRIYAIEAIPELCSRLVKMFDADPRVSVVNAAVGNSTGLTTFNIAADSMGYSGLVKREVDAVSTWRQIDVQIRRLDDVMSIGDMNAVSVIKLDLEGGEFDALRGGVETIRRSKPLIIFENGLIRSAKLYGYSWNDFREFFVGVGYEVFDFFGREITEDYWNNRWDTYMYVATPILSDATYWRDHEFRRIVEECV